jgi:hypothetical protein
LRSSLRPLVATIPLVIVSLASVGALITSDPTGSSHEPVIYKLILRTTYPARAQEKRLRQGVYKRYTRGGGWPYSW